MSGNVQERNSGATGSGMNTGKDYSMKINRRQYQRNKTIANRRFESQYFPKVKKAIDREISSLIEAAGAGRDYTVLANGELASIVKAMHVKVGTYHARQEDKQLPREKSYTMQMEKKGFGFSDIWVQLIIEYFQSHLLQHVTFGTVHTMREKLLPFIQQAITDGKSYAAIAKEIAEQGFAKYQAARIVRTEVNSASNVGTMVAGKTYEYETNKEWIAANDARTRGRDGEDHADHWSLDGQQVDYNAPFVDPKNGVQLMQPGDPKAIGNSRDRAATTINCRCTVALVARRDAKGRLIKKTTV